MAKCKIQGFGDVEKALTRLASSNGAGIEAVKQAAPVVKNAMKKKIREVANRTDKHGRPYATGQLAESVEITDARENNLGAYSVVKVSGKNKRGLDNVMEFVYLENGAQHKIGDKTYTQQARPVRTPVIHEVEDEVQKIMERSVFGAIEGEFDK